jgi:hypothetical protein
VLVQKSVTTITNVAGRLSGLDARESWRDAQEGERKKMAIELPETFVLRFFRREKHFGNAEQNAGVFRRIWSFSNCA